VTVEHYTGQLFMRRSERPDLMILFIDGLMVRSRLVAAQISDQAMEAAIRRRLGLPAIPEGEEEGQENGSQPEAEPAKPAPSSTKRTRLGNVWFYLTNFFYMRFEDGDLIFYRKHWFILLKKIWLSSLVNIFWLLVGYYLWSIEIFSFPLNFLFWFVIFLVTGFWWLYNLLDWHDDIFILTLDKIIDVDKKPFLSAQKKEATLDRILSIEHSRVGLTGVILNFGTVIIKVGETPFTFDLVRDPAEVQYEISERKNAARRRQDEQSAVRERERVANWLALYHKQAVELEDLEKSAEEDGFSG
jgi:hypothetical protein